MTDRRSPEWQHEWQAFDDDVAAARAAFEAGDLTTAVKLAADPAHKFSYGQDPKRFQLLADLYEHLGSVNETGYRAHPWQAKLLSELYVAFPKQSLEAAFLKHDFAEPAPNDHTVSGAESVRLAVSSLWAWLGGERPVAISRNLFRFKLWDLETGEVLYSQAEDLKVTASAFGRDGTHLLFAIEWNDHGEEKLRWSVTHKHTCSFISTARGGTYEKSHYANVKYYPIRGEVLSVQGEQTLEVDRESFEKHPIRGEVLPPREFKKQTPRYLEYLSEVYSEAECEVILREDREAREREKQIVRVRQYQTLTLTHEEVEGYLFAGTNTFVASDGTFPKPQLVSDLWSNTQIYATLAVEDDECWLESIAAPGKILRGMYSQASTPITAICISSDGALGLRNGNGPEFGLWNLFTGERLREFKGHTDRVTCLCAAVDVSFVLSGSEDKTVKLWQPLTAECVHTFVGHEGAITAVCLSMDGTKAVSASADGIIKVWNKETGDCLRTIRAHWQNISALHLTVDGKFAVSGSWDKTVKLWDLSNGMCLKTFEHSDWVTAVDMTPDGRYLVSSGYDATRVWELIWKLEPRELADWDEGVRPYLEILLNANAAWDGKLGTEMNMTQEEIEQSLRRQSPSWHAWHAPSNKNDWHRVWHLSWDIRETLGYAGFGWLGEGVSRETEKTMDEWQTANSKQ